MKTRAQQREDTRARIVRAARGAFADLGFKAASTREIASRAKTNQGLITYHFRTKDDLWRAAVGEIFDLLREQLEARLSRVEESDREEFARESIREYVRVAAAYPELFRIMVDQGKHADARTRWLVDKHLKPLYSAFVEYPGSPAMLLPENLRAHAYYVLAGAGSVIFALAPECKRLTGLDPGTPEAIEAHADFVARLLVPERS